MRFDACKPSGQPVDALTGFVNEHGEANGRPVGVAFDKGGALLVAEDVGNVVWRVPASCVPVQMSEHLHGVKDSTR